MLEPAAASRDTAEGFGEISSTLTPGEAAAERIARARKGASNCLLLAVVTSPEISADLIDRAIELTGHCQLRRVTISDDPIRA